MYGLHPSGVTYTQTEIKYTFYKKTANMIQNVDSPRIYVYNNWLFNIDFVSYKLPKLTDGF